MGGGTLHSFHKIETEIMKAFQTHTERSAFHTAEEDELVCISEETGYKETNLQQHRDWTQRELEKQVIAEVNGSVNGG